jgi:hypothetical protein
MKARHVRSNKYRPWGRNLKVTDSIPLERLALLNNVLYAPAFLSTDKINNIMKNLQLSLIAKWFEMTKAGVKKEDYRELTPYWYAIFCLYDGQKKSKKFWEFAPINSLSFDTSKVSFNEYENNIMTLGYPKSDDSERILKLKHNGIKVWHGNTEWGAVQGRLYFVITHGAVL